MKIIIALLSLIVVTLILGPIAGGVLLVAFALCFIPKVGSIVAVCLVLGFVGATFGKEAVFIGVPVLLGALFLWVQYEKAQIGKTIDDIYGNKLSHIKQPTGDIKFKRLELHGTELFADDKTYQVVDVNIKWLMGYVRIFNKGKFIGRFKMSTDDFKVFSNKFSTLEKQNKKSLKSLYQSPQ